MKEDFNSLNNTWFGYCIQKLLGIEVFIIDVLKSFLQQVIHIDIGYVHNINNCSSGA